MTNTQQFEMRVDEVLHYIWDPIGVAGIPEARDEYLDYIQIVVELALAGDEGHLSDHLHTLEMGPMGLIGNKEKCDTAAEILMAWKEALLGDSESAI